MVGGILQLVARSYADLYIIKEPEITFFKLIYRRHSNFTTYPLLLKFQQELSFGKSGKCKIPKIADLMRKIYVVYKLPTIKLAYKSATRSQIRKILLDYDITYNYSEDSILSITDKIEIKNLIISKINYLFLNDFDNPLLNKIGVYTLLKINENATGIFREPRVFSLYIADPIYPGAFNNNNTEILTKLNGCWEFKEGCELWDKIYWMIDINPPKHAWVSELGHYLTESIKFEIGGVTIDEQNSEIIKNYHTITNDTNKRYDYLIGNTSDLNNYDNIIKKGRYLYIPINFWFNRHNSTALPLVAMNYTDIYVDLKLRNFDKLFYYDSNAEIIKKPKMKTFIMGDFVYVENEERNRLCNNKLEYLIDAIQTTGEQIITKDDLRGEYIEIKTIFDEPSKYLFWIIKPIKDYKNWNNYEFIINNQIINPIETVTIKFNGRQRETEKHYGIYQYVKAYNTESGVDENLFMYNYALFPHELQPSGSASYGNLAESSIFLKLNPLLINELQENNYQFKISVYSSSVNILRVFSGMAGLAFIGSSVY
jgi:hypothetical protein